MLDLYREYSIQVNKTAFRGPSHFLLSTKYH